MKHVIPISKASADKQVLSTISTIISILSVVMPLLEQIMSKEGSRR